VNWWEIAFRISDLAASFTAITITWLVYCRTRVIHTDVKEIKENGNNHNTSD
jgi:hypothetical protein